jgi:hypothetical protein
MYVPATSRIRMFVPISIPRGMTDWVTLPGSIALVHDDDERTAEGTEPGDADWHAAVWIGRSLTLIISGPGRGGTAEYDPGDYMAWAVIDAGAERPVLRSGRVRIGGPGYPP